MILSKRKQRASLIPMEEGAELVVPAEGWSVIQSSGRQDDQGDEHDDVGVVSADEESRAQ
jgi:hypothetical protein